jgi:cell wall-associated NlpC family hydrolase
MSVQSVMGRIDQILQMQQQLLDPQSASGAGATTAATSESAGAIGTAGTAVLPATAGTGVGSSTGTSPTFSQMLASAQSSATPTAAVGSLSNADAGSKVQSMVNMANSLLGKPYVWGGGHGGWTPTSGYDCSGFVSAVLHAGGYLSAPADTTSLPNQPGIESGRGQYVTIYDRAQPGENGHVIIEIGGQFYESGGETGPWGGGGGVAKIGRPTAAYLATFPNVLHLAGL